MEIAPSQSWFSRKITKTAAFLQQRCGVSSKSIKRAPKKAVLKREIEI